MLKAFLRHIIFTSVSLYIISTLFPQVRFSSISVLLITSVVLTLLAIFVRPILKILWLPVNIITFGLFAWVVNILIMYLAMFLVPGFSIGNIHIDAFSVGPLYFQAVTLSRFWSMVFVSFLISFGNGILSWLL